MAPQQISSRSAESACRSDEVPLLGAQHDSANQSRWPRPTHGSKHRNDQKKRLKRNHFERQESAKSKKKVKPRQSQKELCKTHQQIISPASEIARNGANAQSEKQR